MAGIKRQGPMELSYTFSLFSLVSTGFFLTQVLKELAEKQTKSVHKCQCSVCFVKPGTVLVFYSEHMPWSLQALHTVGDLFQAHNNKSYNIWTSSFTEKMHTFHVTLSESLTWKTGQCVKYSWYKWAKPSAIKYLRASQKNSNI